VNEPREITWREVLVTAGTVFLVALVGVGIAVGIWYRDIMSPRIVFLGSGDRLSVLISDGPSRLLIASGDDPTGFENALTSVLPIFARRVDVLLVSGTKTTLLAPLAASQDEQVRETRSLGTIPSSIEASELGEIAELTVPARIQLSPEITLAIETALPADAAPDDPVSWRAIVERGQTRIVVLSDGEAAGLFSTPPPASVIAVAGDDPVAGWDTAPGVALVVAAGKLSGPNLRERFAEDNAPRWGFRVASGEALTFHFAESGLAVIGESAQQPEAAATPLP
jgi:hypothetical protein